MTLKQKSYIFVMCIFVTFVFLFCFFYRFSWVFSFVCGFISYILLIIVTFRSIGTKIQQKIAEAKRQDSQDSQDSQDLQDSNHEGRTAGFRWQNTEKMQTKQKMDFNDSESKNGQTARFDAKNLQEQNTQKLQNIESKDSRNSKNTSSQPKKILRLLDLSKVSLGFEFSFSLPRFLAFLFMILCFVLLIIYNIFHPIIYLVGVFLALVCVLLWLFFCALNVYLV